MSNPFDKKDLIKKLSELDQASRDNLILNTTVSDTVEKVLNTVENDAIKLSVKEVRVNKKYDNEDIEAQKTVSNRQQVWADEVRADLELIDKETGEVIDSKTNVKIADVPKLTDRLTYLIKGNEYQVSSQPRLKPGVYTKTQSNGEISSFFNVDKSVDFDRGYNNDFKVDFDPESKLFSMRYNGKKVPLYNALKLLGVSDDAMSKKWGDNVLEANRKVYGKHYDRDSKKMHQAIFGYEPKEGEEVSKKIKDRLFETRLDPEVTKITLGKEYSSVNSDTMLDASRKIIDINRGAVEEDDRESLMFKTIAGIDTHIKEKLIKSSGNVARNIAHKLGKTREINKSISSQMFRPYIEGTLTGSQISNPPNQTNIMSISGEASKMTPMGEGGIGSSNAITDNMRQISDTEAGFIDPLHTPEGGAIGITKHMAMGAVAVNGELYNLFKNTRSGKHEMMSPKELYDKNVAFPDQYDDKGRPKSKMVKVVHQGKMKEVDSTKVDYAIGSAQSMFDTSVNSIPFLDSIQGNRGLTASKMQEQAVSLVNRDKPLFDIQTKGGASIGSILGERIAVPKAKKAGEITEVTDNYIMIDGKEKVQLYNNFSLNSESFLHNTPLVKVGDNVKKGQILADNNFTRDGKVSLGANLKVAFMPFKGFNYEDSAIISESGAKKLKSQHMYDLKSRRSSKGTFSKSKFQAYYPEELTAKNASKLDKDGIIKPGTIVESGDVVIAHMEPQQPTADDLAVGRLDKQLKRDMSNNAVKWENGHKGVVTSVEKHGNNVVVNIKTEEELKVADKISGLHGNKHIISAIVPDNEMPFNPETGERIDLTMSPIGVSNRINTSQLLENAAGKLAYKTGKAYTIENFQDADNSKKLMSELEAAGISDKDVLVNPETGKQFKNPIANGMSHILKLEHKIDHKFSSRYRDGHDANEQPVSGGHHGGKNLGRMETAAMLARGASANLEEMFSIKGQRNDEYWRAMEMGLPTPPPASSFAWDKFMAMSKGAGVNIEQNGKKFVMKPLTDKDILAISSGELKRPTETYRKKNNEPVNGGLFDPQVVGGMRGDNYSHFKLPEKILNPMQAKAAASVVGLSQKDLEDVMVGNKFVDRKTGEVVKKGTANSFSGGPAVEMLLSKVDVDKSIVAAEADIANTKAPTELNKLHRKIRYLKGLQKNDMKPTDYLIENVLVTPSKFRPMFAMGTDETVIIADENDLYQQVAQTSKAIKEHNKAFEGMPEDIKNLMGAEARGQIYNDMKALQGLSDPTAYLHKVKNKKGFLRQIDGGKTKQTKEGFFQDKVMERRQDLVGRSTIILNPELGGDELGIPEEMATDIFRPFIMKKLVEWGYTPLDAKKAIDEGSDAFTKARDVVSKERLVIANRAPSLHKWNMTAFYPKLVKGKSIEVPSVVISKNFGGDFDGDTFQIHTPVGSKALEEAKTMLPSKNMLKTGYGTVLNMPDMDMVAGTFLASKGIGGKSETVKVKSIEELRDKIKSGEIEYADNVKIGNRDAKAIFHEVNSVLPEKHQRWSEVLDKSNIEKWIKDVSETGPVGKGMALADKLKETGNRYITDYGLTLGVSDTVADQEIKNKVLSKAAKRAEKEGVIVAYHEAKKEGEKLLAAKHGETSQIGIPIISGAGKGIGNTADIALFPGILMDANDNPISMPITKSYSEGIDTAGYWAAAHGARGGNIKKSVSSFKPGWLTKDLVNSIYETRIAAEKPMDKEGLEYEVSDSKAIMDRYLAQDVKDSNGEVVAKRNDLINSDTVNKLKQRGVKSVHVQSPITDPTPGDGFSSWSYGLDDNKKLMNRGDHVGIISAHTITEPSLNLAMKSFHTGGKLEGGAKKKVNTGTAFDAMDRVLRFVKNAPDKASLAQEDAVVKKVKESSVGGFEVEVENKKGDKDTWYVGHTVDPTVKAGDKVKKGDQISSGTPNPHEMLELKGMHETRKYLINKISELNNNKLDKRNIETIVRGITNTTRIEDPGKSVYTTGDVVPYSTAEYLNKEYNSGIKHKPFLMPTGIGAKFSASEDFLGRLAGSRLKDVFQDGSGMAWESDIRDDAGNPIAKLVSGVK